MSLFETEDYRAFLKTWIRSLPKNGRGEVNRIAEVLNVNPTVVSQTLSGTRDFTPEQTLDLTEHMGLSELESDYFATLVQIEKAGTAKLKTHLRKKLVKLRKDSVQVAKRIQEHRSLSETERATFYSSAIYAAVRLFSSVGDGVTLEQVCQRFDLSRARAQEILSFLVSTKLCLEKDGVYERGPQLTHLEATSPFITKHHTNWRVKSLQRAEDLAATELMYTGPMCLARADFERLRERMLAFIKEVIGEVQNSEAEDVACFNIDFFWVKK